MTYGYARVSSKDQNEARQLEQLRQYVSEERYILVDKASGKDFNRPNWNTLVGTDTTAPMLREGDLLVVVSIDRLGRNYNEIRKQWQRITQEIKSDIKVLDMPLLDTSRTSDSLDNRFIADLTLQILAYVAEKERAYNKERQRQGIEIAKATGRYKNCGRKKMQIDEDLLRAECVKWRNGEQTAVQTFKNCGLKKVFFYKKIKELGL